MEPLTLRIISTEHVTHDVLRITLSKPAGLEFVPGQAADISINKSGWREEKRPFTFTCLPSKDIVEFTIKTYPARKGVTNELLKLKPNDEFLLHEVFGAIAYQGEGVFIAGGAGVTPFIAIFRDLKQNGQIGNNKLLFANKTKADIILENEFREILGKNFVNILADEKVEGYAHGMINLPFLRSNITDLNQMVYLCGPPPMMDAVTSQLKELGIRNDHLIQEAI